MPIAKVVAEVEGEELAVEPPPMPKAASYQTEPDLTRESLEPWVERVTDSSVA